MDSKSAMFKCLKCDAEFKHKKSLNRHIAKDVHEGQGKLMSKSEVMKFFNTPAFRINSVISESKLKSDSKLKTFRCPVCNMDFTRQSTLTRHNKTYHSEENVSNAKNMKSNFIWECSYCNSNFTRKTPLTRHIRTFHNYSEAEAEFYHETINDEELFSCPECDAEFTKEIQLNKHFEHVHEEKTPYQVSKSRSILNCVDTDTIFKQEQFFYDNSISQNLEVDSSDLYDGKKPYKCNICDASFLQKSIVEKHFENVHGEKNSSQYQEETIFVSKPKLECGIVKDPLDSSEGSDSVHIPIAFSL